MFDIIPTLTDFHWYWYINHFPHFHYYISYNWKNFFINLAKTACRLYAKGRIHKVYAINNGDHTPEGKEYNSIASNGRPEWNINGYWRI